MNEEQKKTLKHLLIQLQMAYYDECEYGEVDEGDLNSDELEIEITNYVEVLIKNASLDK